MNMYDDYPRLGLRLGLQSPPELRGIVDKAKQRVLNGLGFRV